jgi:hypothetical protein
MSIEQLRSDCPEEEEEEAEDESNEDDQKRIIVKRQKHSKRYTCNSNCGRDAKKTKTDERSEAM